MSSTSTSKTSAISSIAREFRAYSRLFAESATGFGRRYRTDVFYRTGWNVVLLQLGFALLMVALTITALAFMYDEVVRGLLQSIADSIASGIIPELDSISIASSLEYGKERAMVLAATGIIIAAAVFGYLVTRIALMPAKDALDVQKQFIGNIAHEIRTPLAIIKTNTEVILFDEKLDGETRTTMKSNLEELDRISETVNNFLSMNALVRAEKMEFVNVDLGTIIDHTIDSLADIRKHKGINVSKRLSEYRTVWGNPSGVEQILVNLMKNALNYTPNGGSVVVSTEPTLQGEIEITIDDAGVGIPEKDLARIFEPFYRGDRSRNRKSGGSGLGLAIVSELVKLHKGRISMKSVVGEGTTVKVTLPCGRGAGRESRMEESEVVIDFSKGGSPS